MAKKKTEKKLEEANFEVSSLAEVKDENGNGIFHMQTKTKIITAISAAILLLTIILIYLTVEKYFDAQMWQVIVWGMCGILSLYAIFSRSIAALLFNIVLFFGVSFFPLWQSGYEKVQPVIEKFSNAEENKIETPPTENNSEVKENNSAVDENNSAVEENNSAVEEKDSEVKEKKF